MNYQVDVYLFAGGTVSLMRTRSFEKHWRARLYAFWWNLPMLGLAFTHAVITPPCSSHPKN